MPLPPPLSSKITWKGECSRRFHAQQPLVQVPLFRRKKLSFGGRSALDSFESACPFDDFGFPSARCGRAWLVPENGERLRYHKKTPLYTELSLLRRRNDRRCSCWYSEDLGSIVSVRIVLVNEQIVLVKTIFSVARLTVSGTHVAFEILIFLLTPSSTGHHRTHPSPVKRRT